MESVNEDAKLASGIDENSTSSGEQQEKIDSKSMCAATAKHTAMPRMPCVQPKGAVEEIEFLQTPSR